MSNNNTISLNNFYDNLFNLAQKYYDSNIQDYDPCKNIIFKYILPNQEYGNTQHLDFFLNNILRNIYDPNNINICDNNLVITNNNNISTMINKKNIRPNDTYIFYLNYSMNFNINIELYINNNNYILTCITIFKNSHYYVYLNKNGKMTKKNNTQTSFSSLFNDNNINNDNDFLTMDNNNNNIINVSNKDNVKVYNIVYTKKKIYDEHEIFKKKTPNYNNEDNLCYMHSAFQLLFNIPYIYDIFKNEESFNKFKREKINKKSTTNKISIGSDFKCTNHTTVSNATQNKNVSVNDNISNNNNTNANIIDDYINNILNNIKI